MEELNVDHKMWITSSVLFLCSFTSLRHINGSTVILTAASVIIVLWSIAVQCSTLALASSCSHIPLQYEHTIKMCLIVIAHHLHACGVLSTWQITQDEKQVAELYHSECDRGSFD